MAVPTVGVVAGIAAMAPEIAKACGLPPGWAARFSLRCSGSGASLLLSWQPAQAVPPPGGSPPSMQKRRSRKRRSRASAARSASRAAQHAARRQQQQASPQQQPLAPLPNSAPPPSPDPTQQQVTAAQKRGKEGGSEDVRGSSRQRVDQQPASMQHEHTHTGHNTPYPVLLPPGPRPMPPDVMRMAGALELVKSVRDQLQQ